jgi:uncharacterized protein YegL
MVDEMPGGALAHRPLHFFWLADCSGSMESDGKIQSLNIAIREAIPEMRKAASGHPDVEVKVRAIKFSSGAQWHISQETPVEGFEWKDLTASGVTDLGKALDILIEALDIKKIGDRAKPPVLVLVSDGLPTDDWKSSLDKLNKLPWGQKAVRIAIAIGGDADIDVLQKFINNPEIKVLQANNAQALVDCIRWVSTVALKKASDEKKLTTSDQVVISNQSDVW